MLSKEEFYTIREVIRNNGEKFTMWGYPAYKLSDDIYMYESDAGYIQRLVLGNYTYEEYDINKDLRTYKDNLEIFKKVYIVTFINNFDTENWKTEVIQVFDSFEKAEHYIDDQGYTEVEQKGQAWYYKTDKPCFAYSVEEFGVQ